jgi:hypothetical protein
LNRKNFYENLSTELLGCFYCFILERLNKGENRSRMLFELSQIEKVAKEREISLLELRIIGKWFIEKEMNHTHHEIKQEEE